MCKRRISIIIIATQDFGDYNYSTGLENSEVDAQCEKLVEALSGSDISIMGLSCHLNGVQVQGIEEY